MGKILDEIVENIIGIIFFIIGITVLIFAEQTGPVTAGWALIGMGIGILVGIDIGKSK